jgi:hypothetical protein
VGPTFEKPLSMRVPWSPRSNASYDTALSTSRFCDSCLHQPTATHAQAPQQQMAHTLHLRQQRNTHSRSAFTFSPQRSRHIHGITRYFADVGTSALRKVQCTGQGRRQRPRQSKVTQRDGH